MADTRINLNQIFSLEKKPSLFAMHKELAEIVKERHPEYAKDFSSTDQVYKVTSGNLLDAYKNIMHMMMLEKIPNFQSNPLVSTNKLIETTLNSFNIEADFEKQLDIYKCLKTLIDKHCGKLTEVNVETSIVR